jgi:hypothetical protein
MKRLLIASVCAALPLAAHAGDLTTAEYNFIQDNAPSQPAVVGHLSLGLGYVNEEYSDGFPDSFDYWLFNGAGRANIDLGGLNLEIEAGGQAAFKDGNSMSSIGPIGHLWGSMGNLALGAYGGVDFLSGAGIGLTVYTLGGEAEAYLGAVTLGADVDYNWTDGGVDGLPGDFWTARGWADLYVTPNTRIGAEVSYASWDKFYGTGLGGITNTSETGPGIFAKGGGTGTAGLDTWGAAVDAEHRFAGTPVSTWIEGRYYYQDLPSACGCDVHNWSGMIGFRVFMDAAGTTLHEHDKMVPWQGEATDFRTAKSRLIPPK